MRLGQSRRAEERRLREDIARDDPDVGEVRIACSGSFAMLFYPQAVALMADAPRLTLRLEAAPQAAVLAGVLDNRFDLGVLGHDPGHPRLQAQHLGQEELCLVLPADAPRCDLRFADLESRGFIAHPDGFTYANDLFTLNFPGEFSGADRLRLRSYVNQIGQIPAPVAAGLGYTLLPRSGVAAYPARDRLGIATLPRPVHHALWLITRRGRPMSARLQRLADLLSQVAAGLG